MSHSLFAISNAQKRLADMLPFTELLGDGVTISTKYGSLIQALRVTGKNYSGLSGDDLEDLFFKRKAFFESLGDDVAISIYCLRKKLHLEKEHVELGNKYAQEIHKKRLKSFKNTYKTDIILTVELKTNSAFASNIALGSKGFSEERFHLQQKQQELSTKVDEIIRLLDSYEAERIGTKEHYGEDILSFWSYLINLGAEFAPPQQSQYLGRLLSLSDIHFNAPKGIISGESSEGQRFAAALSINAYPHETHGNLLDILMQVRHAFSIIQHIQPESNESSKAKLSNMMASMESVMNVPFAAGFLGSRYNELDDLGNKVESGDLSLIHHTLSIIVYGKNEKELEDGIQKIKSTLMQSGVSLIRERLNLESTYWAQFPDLHELGAARQFMVTSENVADFITFGGSYEGLTECAFGKQPVAYFKTKENTQFAFTFHATTHEQAPGHTMIIGPTGSGKSVLAMHLIQSCLKYNDDTYGAPFKALIFDSARGVKIPTEAFGGDYINATKAENIPLNPMKLPDQPTHRLFLQNWLAMLIGYSGDISPKDQEIIARAVHENYELPESERSLHALRALFMERTRGDDISFYDRIKKWLPQEDDPTKFPNLNAAFFNSNRNALDFSARLIGFDMAEALRNKDLLPPLSSFIFHSFTEFINENPSPHICFIDEMAQYLENDIFAPFILKLVREARKRNGVFFGAVQEPSVLIHSPHGQAIAENLTTFIVLKNSRARAEEYDALGFTDREIEWIKTPSADREVMVKRHGGESIILNADLSGLDELIYLYSGKLDDVTKAAYIKANHPEDWVERFIAWKTGDTLS